MRPTSESIGRGPCTPTAGRRCTPAPAHNLKVFLFGRQIRRSRLPVPVGNTQHQAEEKPVIGRIYERCCSSSGSGGRNKRASEEGSKKQCRKIPQVCQCKRFPCRRYC